MVTYTLQGFVDVARRRAKEAQVMLGVPKKFCDGAVTCGLLAAECALKAALLWGHQANTVDSLDLAIQEGAFHGKAGHNLAALWSLIPTKVKGQGAPSDAVSSLNGRDRYRHRYGETRPYKKDAQKILEDVEKIVDWMGKVTK